jgi:8-oxo-dGTP pyrophosphatase MutT (NUDIX family)
VVAAWPRQLTGIKEKEFVLPFLRLRRYYNTAAAAGKEPAARGRSEWEGAVMRHSQAAQALVRRRAAGRTEYLAQWNQKWQSLHLVGGHRNEGESFRDCLCRELHEELGLRPETDYRLPEQPFAHLEYTAFSKAAGEETAYVMELFEVELAPAAAARISSDPANAWVSEAEVLAGRAADGRAVSATTRLLLEKAGLLGAAS